MSGREAFAQLLEDSRPIVVEGSLAAELRRRGYKEQPTALYTLKEPLLVETIHRAFVQAGVRIILANTFQANALTLERYGLADKVYEINRKGVWIARCAAVRRALVAGVVGPVGKFLKPIGPYSAEEVRQAFIDQIIALLDGGADLLLLKSFIDLEELLIAIEAAQFVDSDVPIIAQKTFPEDGAVLATEYPVQVARALKSAKVTVVGANGAVGPQRMLGIMERMAAAGCALSAQPDIGIPIIRDGQMEYNADPVYVAQSIRRLAQGGVQIVGADGGASLEFVQAIVQHLEDVTVGSVPFGQPKIKQKMPMPKAAPQRSRLWQKLQAGEFVTTVELDIPRGFDMSAVLEGARYLAQQGVDAVNISDGARARLRMNPIAISVLVQQTVGIETVTHYACRDRNMVGLQADMLGAWQLGIKNILAVTGDPTHIGDYPYATTVRDLDSIGLIRALHLLNQGKDLAGNDVAAASNFTICCACNPAAYNLDEEVDRLFRKVDQGAEVVFTQPLYDFQLLEQFLEKIHSLQIYLIVGILPIRSLRHATFLHYEVPGIEIPEWVRKRIETAARRGKEAERRAGQQIAVEFARAARPLVHGFYFMPPFKKYEMAVEIIRRLSPERSAL